MQKEGGGYTEEKMKRKKETHIGTNKTSNFVGLQKVEGKYFYDFFLKLFRLQKILVTEPFGMRGTYSEGGGVLYHNTCLGRLAGVAVRRVMGRSGRYAPAWDGLAGLGTICHSMDLDGDPPIIAFTGGSSIIARMSLRAWALECGQLAVGRVCARLVGVLCFLSRWLPGTGRLGAWMSVLM